MNVTGTISVTMTATAKTRMHLALHHLLAGCKDAARMKEIETGNAGKEFGAFWEDILHCGLGVATHSVSALEAYANELLLPESTRAWQVKGRAAEAIISLLDRQPILDKFDMAMALSADLQMKRGAKPCQDAASLIAIRNEIVHFRPEWFGEKGRHSKLSATLAKRFSLSPFLPDEPPLPRAWASASFGMWAVRSTVAFIEWYYEQLPAAKSPIEKFIPLLEAAMQAKLRSRRRK